MTDLPIITLSSRRTRLVPPVVFGVAIDEFGRPAVRGVIAGPLNGDGLLVDPKRTGADAGRDADVGRDGEQYGEAATTDLPVVDPNKLPLALGSLCVAVVERVSGARPWGWANTTESPSLVEPVDVKFK